MSVEMRPRDKLLSHFKAHVDSGPNEVLYGWVDGKGNITKELTRKDVWTKAMSIAHTLLNDYGIQRGERVLLCYLFDLDFIQAFLGCLVAGVVAVPIYPPNPSRLKYSIQKMKHIIKDCDAKLALSHKPFTKYIYMMKLKAGFSTWPKIPFVNTDKIKDMKLTSLNEDMKTPWKSLAVQDTKGKPQPNPNDSNLNLSFLQYTSGSTGDPKGVRILYNNLEHNLQLIWALYNQKTPVKPRLFCWVPQYHDMGLIGNYLFAFYRGIPAYFMSPQTFLRSPALWLHSMWKTKSNCGTVPNFGFALALRKWKLRPVPEGFTLKDIIGISAGGEENQRSTFKAFEQFFSENYDLPPNVLTPAYGMAEHVLMISVAANSYHSYSKKDPRKVECCTLSKASIDNGVKIKVVDPDTCEELDEGEEGELWLQSPSVADGYWGRPKKSQETFCAVLKSDRESGKWLRTGDSGYREGNKFFFVSRMKDLIIVRGRNYSPKDIEFSVDEVSGVRPGCTIAFAIELGDTEGVVIVSELRAKTEKELKKMGYDTKFPQIAAEMRAQVSASEGLQVTDVMLIEPRSIPKTSSGKLRRSTCKQMYIDQKLKVVYRGLGKGFSSSIMPGGDAKKGEEVTLNLSEVEGEEALKTAMVEFLSSGSDWKSIESRELGTMVDSLKVVEMSGSLKTAYGLIFEVDTTLLAHTPSSLLALTRTHCESFCKLRGVKSWVAATVHLPREIDAPGAVVIRDNSETDVAFLPKIAELRLRKLEEKASKASKESSESEKKKHKNADKEPLLQGMDAQKEHKGDIKVDQTCAFGQYSTFDLEEKVENSKEEIGEGESFEFKGGDVPPCKDPRIATTFCSKVCECLRGFFELLAVISFFFILSSCAIPAYHYAKWAADLPSPWGYIHLGIYNVDSPLDNSEGFDMCTAKTFGILLSQVVTIWAFTFTVAVIVLKWLIVGQYKPGNVRVASLAWYRWWYVDRLQGIWEAFIGPFLLDTCLATVFYKLMGADIAWSATVQTFIREADLVVVGSHATVSGILMTRLFVDSEEMVFDRIRIGDGADVQESAVLEPGAVVCRNTTILPQSCVYMEQTIPPGGTWGGNPIKKYEQCDESEEGSVEESCCERSGLEVVKIVTLLLHPMILGFLASPGVMVFWWLDPFSLCGNDGNPHPNVDFFPFDPKYFPLVFFTVVWFTAVMMQIPYLIALKWLLAGHIHPGIYTPNTYTKWRRWYLGVLRAQMSFVFIPLGICSVLNWYNRMLGVSFAKGVQCSALDIVHPEDAHLISIGEDSFLSKCVLKPHTKLRDGRCWKGRINIGDKCSLGYRATVEGQFEMQTGSSIGWLSYVGKMSPPPTTGINDDDEDVERGLVPGGGRSSFVLEKGCMLIGVHYKNVKKSQRFKRNLNTLGDDGYVLKTNVISETFYQLRLGFLLAFLGAITCTFYYLTIVVAYEIGIKIGDHIDDTHVYIVVFGFFVFVWAATLMLVGVIHKWIMVWKHVPGSQQTRNDMPFPTLFRQLRVLQAMNYTWAQTKLVGHMFKGTRMYSAYVWMLGCNIGYGTYIMTKQFTYDHDLITIGDKVVLDSFAHVSGHVFVDGKFKQGYTKIGSNALVGPYSYVNCGDHIGDNGTLCTCSKLLHDKIDDSKTAWGVPAHCGC